MIIRGGENIYPLEVENFLLTMPGVLDAQVVGVPGRAARRDRAARSSGCAQDTRA